jgi:integrase
MGTIVRLKAPKPEKPTVGRRKNTDYRVREYLTEAEIGKLLVAAGTSRNPNRDRLIVLLTFRHALRVSELVSQQGGTTST